MEQWKLDYEKLLVGATGYSGSSASHEKIISASSLGNDMLQLFMDYKHGKQGDTKFEASNVGSMYQLGVDKACENAMEGQENPQYISAQRFKHTLPNGWVCSGEIDQRDTINKVIIDNKVSTGTALKKVIQEGKDHQYALQLGVYKYLVWKATGEHYTGALAFVDKGSSYFNPRTGDMITYLNVETYGYEEIEKMLIDKSDKLQAYIDNDVEPEKCANLFPFKSKGITKPMRCIYYCSYNKNCRHFSDFNAERSFLDDLEVTTTVTANPYVF